jgi:hypothetical protein
MHPDTFLDSMSQNTHMWNLMKIRPVGAELFYAQGQTQTDVTNLVITFRSFGNVPKNLYLCLLFRES